MLLAQQLLALGGYVGRVSVKPPVFYRSIPGVWFRQMESQFFLTGITNDEKEFHHILVAIPEDVAINLPMDIDIKDHIYGIFQKSKQEMIEEALGMISLDSQKLSFCLMRIQGKLAECNLTLDDNLLKHRLMQVMPLSLKTALSADLELPVEQFPKLADTIYSYSNTVCSCHKSSKHICDLYTADAIKTIIQSAFNAIQPISKQIKVKENTHRPFTAGQRPKICRYHLYFAEKAKSCETCCQWPGQKPKNIESTPRANSPANPSNL